MDDRSKNINNFRPEIILIAASTGGPTALEKILAKIHVDFPAPILIIQHNPAYFLQTLAKRLNRVCRLRVKIAENRETISAGTAYIAPDGLHLKISTKNRFFFDDSPPVNGIRPAADVLFESVADNFYGHDVLVIILTGMGNDGKEGLARLKEKKTCFCLVQSEKTCVIYGMPKAAADDGLADKILDLEDIPLEMENFNYLRKVS
ncbi:MAG: CheB methylesterase domain-containing protein [Treponema sp.]|nr:CheB methylesterase domain-containing protein [Treponema sp.]